MRARKTSSVTLSEFSTRSTSSVASATRVCRSASSRLKPRRQQVDAAPRLGDPGVDLRDLGVEQRVVEAQLEQLRVGELEHVLDVGVLGDRLHHQRGVPGEHREVVLEVREALREQLAAGRRRERPRLAHQQPRDVLVAQGVRRQPRARAVLEAVHAEDDVVLGDRRLARAARWPGRCARAAARAPGRRPPPSRARRSPRRRRRRTRSRAGPAGATSRARSETTPKSKRRAENSTSRGSPAIVTVSSRGSP